MYDVDGCSATHTVTVHDPVSEMTYTVSSGTLNSTIPYHAVHDVRRTVFSLVL